MNLCFTIVKWTFVFYSFTILKSYEMLTNSIIRLYGEAFKIIGAKPFYLQLYLSELKTVFLSSKTVEYTSSIARNRTLLLD